MISFVPQITQTIDNQIVLFPASEVIFLFFREYKYTHEIAAAVVKHLGYRGFDAALVKPEEYDVSLRARNERLNTWCRQLGKRNVCLVSIHTNAAVDANR